MKQLTTEQMTRQYHWTGDEINYLIDYEKVDGHIYITGITRSMGQHHELISEGGWASYAADADADQAWTAGHNAIDAVHELVTIKSRKTKRTRENFSDTVDWMQNLLLNQRELL